MDVKKFLGSIEEIVRYVEAQTPDLMEVVTSANKKEAAVKLINKLVDIPYLPEFVEAQIFGAIVDTVVFLYNEYSLWPKDEK